MPENSNNRTEERLQVNIELKGEVRDLFLAYKEKELMPNNAATGYKLMVERLREIFAVGAQV